MALDLLVLRPGSVDPQVLAAHGDFDRWFADVLRTRVDTWTVVEATRDPLPPARAFDACLVTGSLCSVRDASPWRDALCAWAARAVADDVPLLGVCYGHQLLARALGGRVEPSPHGRICGSVPVQLTEAGAGDALFAGLPPRFPASFSHHDEVTSLPDGAVHLAGAEHTRVAAFALGSARGVQFHPELTRAARRALASVDTGTPLGWPAGDDPTEATASILRAFVDGCRR